MPAVPTTHHPYTRRGALALLVRGVPAVSDDSRIRGHVWIRGRVQGVWFRDACRREALARGLAGWVRNCPDGSVEGVFEGAPAAVEAMIEWCRQGPPRARVDSVETREELPTGETGFRVM